MICVMSGESTHGVFLLMHGEQIAASTAIWRITDEQSAIENFFSTPAFSNQNCASTIITYALKEMKRSGYAFATLGMRGQNEKAGRLYQSLGFELYYNQIELVYRFH